MPPTAIESDYEPEIELPDFRELGKTLKNLSCFDYEEYKPEDFVDNNRLLKASGWKTNEDEWERLPLDPINSDDDSPFVRIKPQQNMTSKAAGGLRSGTKKSGTAVNTARTRPAPSKTAQPPSRSNKLPPSTTSKPRSTGPRTVSEFNFEDYGAALGAPQFVDDFEFSISD